MALKGNESYGKIGEISYIQQETMYEFEKVVENFVFRARGLAF
ncbi:hypothetical protein FOCG_10725 [Fusarium oxysporum f. sp. radicis-lycopersici 26381]|uniref:Uncharacterized protein n=1 Tax=Fusarium oxysporum Fo47 TaxID=660027 RepID=W9JVI6_FUSOX|nr:hypothetical protein FOZG_12496 [Fusarium oxysporum Fo47]EWZ95367.1 hypothetical protein FOWG_05286 [Fusarium oxysporum f. sp. lycopersici MN25]EXL48254.1 hypothetical protein FOCG_10725 [Fusarium oxysporum f. sp. radicis-lycopersici 26381]